MSRDILALVIAGVLGAAVIAVGMRRNLSETTRDGIRRFERDPEEGGATLGLYQGPVGPQPQRSPRQWRWLAPFYLVFALVYGVFATSSAHERPWHLAMAGTWVLFGLIALWRGFFQRSEGPAS